MANTTSKKSSIKASSAKTSGKPPPGDKTFRIDTEIHFYDIEDGDETEEGQEAEILVVYDSRLAASNKNLIKRKFLYINTFNKKVPSWCTHRSEERRAP